MRLRKAWGKPPARAQVLAQQARALAPEPQAREQELQRVRALQQPAAPGLARARISPLGPQGLKARPGRQEALAGRRSGRQETDWQAPEPLPAAQESGFLKCSVRPAEEVEWICSPLARSAEALARLVA